MPIAKFVAFLPSGPLYDLVMSVRPFIGEFTTTEVRLVDLRCYRLLQIQRIHINPTPNGEIVVIDYNRAVTFPLF